MLMITSSLVIVLDMCPLNKLFSVQCILYISDFYPFYIISKNQMCDEVSLIL